MSADPRFPFDPNSAGARKLAASGRASVPVDIVITSGMYVRAGKAYVPSDHLTVPKALADQLIASGVAARSGNPD